MKPHHIGYLVKDMQQSIQEMLFLGYKQMSDVIYDEYREIDICFMDNNGYIVELIVPKSEKSVVAKLAKKIGVSPYHICYSVQSIDLVAESLRNRGYIPTGQKQCAPAIKGHEALFLFHPNMGIVELVEE